MEGLDCSKLIRIHYRKVIASFYDQEKEKLWTQFCFRGVNS